MKNRRKRKLRTKVKKIRNKYDITLLEANIQLQNNRPKRMNGRQTKLFMKGRFCLTTFTEIKKGA